MKNMPEKTHFTPRAIYIQTSTGCDNACSLCPHPVVYPGPARIIDESLWEKATSEACAFPRVTYICLTLHNEPFTDPHLSRRIREVNAQIRRLSATWSALITNGRALQDKTLRNALAKAEPGVVFMSLISGNPDEYERITGRSFAVSVNTIKLVAQSVPTVIALVARTRNTNTDFVRELLHRGPGCDRIHIQFNPLTTQGGLVPEARAFFPSKTAHHLGSACPYPSHFLYILACGSCIRCCFDWTREGALGTIREQSLAEIAHNERSITIREELARGIYRSPQCKICSAELRFRTEEA